MPNASVTSIGASASTHGRWVATPATPSTSPTTVVAHARVSVRCAPIRVCRNADAAGHASATTAEGTSTSPVDSGLQPRSASSSGMPSSSANQLAGTTDAHSELRTTVAFPTTPRGRNPSGRARTHSAVMGTPTASSTPPATAATAPAPGDCTSSTRPVTAVATITAPDRSTRAPSPRTTECRHR